MSTLVAVWWLSFWTAVGLCLGSFLNAVVYRLPRRRSLRVPLWSACPHCRKRIALYDNIPILSFILLRGRCRHCSVPIATRYPVIEAMMALIVLMLLDAFLIGHVRGGLSGSEFGLTDQLSYDWPILVAHAVLFACLLAMSAIDLEHYWVDIRFTNFVTVAGFVAHAIWTPRHSFAWPRPTDATAVVCWFALVGLGITWVVRICVPSLAGEDAEEHTGDAPTEAADEGANHGRPPPSLASPSRVGSWTGLFLLVALFAALLFVCGDVPIRHAPRALAPLAFFFLLIVSESTVPRDSDAAILQAIHDERKTARSMVLGELVLLVPAVVFGGVGYWVVGGGGELAGRVVAALHAEASLPGLALFRHWTPLQGLATAAAGYLIAGAVGWLVRIVFTLAFGKEAFGVGDIHLMAAAGCVAGWPVVVLAFFVTCLVAMVGWLLTLPFKRTRALPLGPWLSLSTLAVVIFYDRILAWPPMARAMQTMEWFWRNTDVTVPRKIFP